MPDITDNEIANIIANVLNRYDTQEDIFNRPLVIKDIYLITDDIIKELKINKYVITKRSKNELF